MGIVGFLDMMNSQMGKVAMQMMVKTMPEDCPPEVLQQVQAGVKEEVEKKTKEMEGAREKYKEAKADRDAAAFKICDTSGDGTLRLTEFLECVVPDGAKANEFLKALTDIDMCG